MDEALAQAEQIEIAVEIAREPDERAAIVVAIAVVDAVERRSESRSSPAATAARRPSSPAAR